MLKNSKMQISFLYSSETMLLFLILSLIITCARGDLSVGDECDHKEKNIKGKCVLLENCKSSIEDIQIKNKHPEICGFKGIVPVVCCPPLIKKDSIAEKKCWEYSESVYKIVPSSNTFVNKEPLNISTCTTGNTALFPFGDGCLNVKSKDFPHMVVLGYGRANKKKWKCSGTLISEQFILTAAHCINTREYGEVKFIRLAELNLAALNDADPQDFYVKEIFKHPDYSPPSKYNDIALIEMDRPTKFNEFIRPACLQVAKEIPVESFIYTGWNQVEVGQEKQSKHLQKIKKYNISEMECSLAFNLEKGISGLFKGINFESQICARNGGNMDDFCEMDSGGPLQINHPQAHCMYSIIGVNSIGTFQSNILPYIYTRVSNYIEWIENIVWSK